MNSKKLKKVFSDSSEIIYALDKKDVGAVIKGLEKKIDEIELTPGEKGDKGGTGEPGKDGTDGKDGINGIDGLDGPAGSDGKNGIDGTDGKNGEPGKDGSPDTPEQIAEKLNKTKESVDSSVIKGLPKLEDFLKDIKKNKSIELKDIKGARLDMGDQRWHGGGGVMNLAKQGSTPLTGAVTLSAGSGVSLTQTGQDIAIASSGSNSFETIAVSGQPNIVADSPTDTLTIVAGSNITLTTNAGTDTITIAATGGGTPGGSDTQVQFNDSSSFGGDAGFTYNKTNNSIALTTADGILSLGGEVFPSRVASTDDAALRMYSGGTYPLGLITEANGAILSLVNNVPQTGSTDNTRIGSIFRLDNRGGAGVPMFSVLRYPIGSTNINDAVYDFVISDVGYVGYGLSTPLGKLEVVAPDTSVVPAFLLRQSNNNAFGYDWDLENNVTGRLDQYVVNNSVRTQYMSVLRTAGQVGFSVIPSGNGQLQVKSGGATTQFSKVGGVIADYSTDSTVGGAEADIYTLTTAASILGANNDKLIAQYGGNFVTVGTELTQLKVYFGGTAIWDSTGVAPTTGTTSWRVCVEIIRVSATVVRYTVSLNTTGASGFAYCTVGELTGLTLSGTNILKITGTSSGVGSGSGDIVGKMGYVKWESAQ